MSGGQDEEIERLEAQVDRVRQIHTPVRNSVDHAFIHCTGCNTRTWPCPTITALDGDNAPLPVPTSKVSP